MKKTEKHNYNLILGIVLTAIVLIPAVIGIFYTPYDTESMNLALKMASPSFSHPMGCDNYGRDIFSRIMKGSSITF